MRLTAHEIAAIADTAAAVFGPSASVRVFGSRLDDTLEGGDIDLYVEVDPGRAQWKDESAFRVRLGEAFGETPVDVLVHERATTLRPIDRHAKRLNEAYAAIDPLIGTLDQVKHYLARRPDLRAGG